MTAWTRLEHHSKFWEVRADGAQLFVRFGKIGTDGQMRLKQLASPGDAAGEIAKLVAGKQKEGFTRAAKSTKATSPSKAAKVPKVAEAGPEALAVFKDVEVCAVWRDGRDVWVGQLFDEDEPKAVLRVGGSFADALGADHGAMERWSFPTAKEAERAAAYLLAHTGGKKVKVTGGTALPDWAKRMKTMRERIARFEPGKGPITLTVDTVHDWIYPRAPSTSWISKRVMVPVLSLVGPLDPRFGKHTRIFVNACPTGDDQVFEIILQCPDIESTVDAYFETYEGVHTIHLSLQVHWSDACSWVVTEHICEKGTTGHYTTTHAGKRAAAEKLFAERVAAIGGERIPQPPKWYRQVLAEIDEHHRHGKRRPGKTTMRAAFGHYVESIAGEYATPSRMLERASHFFGGTPRFCQENWDFRPKNLCGKDNVLYLFTLGSGDLGWTEILNDGDLGALTFFAAPGDPFGTMAFSCH